MIHLSKPYLWRKEALAVYKVLKSWQLCFWPKLKEFEDRCAKVAGTSYACAVNSGTSWLHLIIRALWIWDWDAIFTPSFTFIASCNCALYEWAKPILIDIEPHVFSIDPEAVENYIESFCTFENGKLVETSSGKHIKALIGVDVFWHPCDIDWLMAICQKYNLYFIEDAAESIWSEYKNKPCWWFGHASIFAFYPNKQLTTWEWGVITTNDKELFDLVSSMKNQWRSSNMQWLSHDKLWYNYRLSDINAAIGVEQLKKLETIIMKRNKIAWWYDDAFATAKDYVETPRILPACTKLSRFVYVIQLKKNIEIDRVIQYLKDKGIQSKNYFTPVHLQKFYQDELWYKEWDLPVTERISKTTLALPFHSSLKRKHVQFIASTLINYLQTL